jgi:hypothetical protein
MRRKTQKQTMEGGVNEKKKQKNIFIINCDGYQYILNYI